MFVCLCLCMGFIVKTIHVILDPNTILVLFTTTMLACVCVFFPGQLSGIPDRYSLIQFTSSLFFSCVSSVFVI